jgi:hypothetical protein
LSNPYFAQTITIAIVIAVHCNNRYYACSQPSPPPFPLPLSIIIIIVTIKIIISIRHAAASNAPLLPPPPPGCHRISKRAAAIAKNCASTICRLRRQAGHCRHAATAATSANAQQLPCYHRLKNK